MIPPLTCTKTFKAASPVCGGKRSPVGERDSIVMGIPLKSVWGWGAAVEEIQRLLCEVPSGRSTMWQCSNGKVDEMSPAPSPLNPLPLPTPLPLDPPCPQPPPTDSMSCGRQGGQGRIDDITEGHYRWEHCSCLEHCFLLWGGSVDPEVVERRYEGGWG